jgi:hypothetical protein
LPFCPECKAEYNPGVRRCSECQLDLVDILPVDAHVESAVCTNCYEDVPVENDFCSYCGTVMEDRNIQCLSHPDSSAVSVCIICHRPQCEECAEVKDGRMFCRDHKKIEVSGDSAVVFQSMDYFEAHIMQGKLESREMKTSLRNFHGIGFIVGGFMESAIGRTLLKYPVKIFVGIDQYREAMEIVNDTSTALSADFEE